MSDQSSQFGGGATAVADAPEVTDAPASGGPKPIVLVLGGVVLLALAAAVYFLMFSGGSDSADEGPVVQTHASTSAAVKAPTAKAPAPAAVPVAAPISGSARDPFKVPAGHGPKTAPSPSASASAAPSAGSTTPATPAGPQVIAVKSINLSTKNASVTVNSKGYSVGLGETFATYFQLVGIIQSSTQCGYFKYGDVSFQLCKGQTLNLQN